MMTMTKLGDAELERCNTLAEVEDWYAENGGYLVTVGHGIAFNKAMKRVEQIGYDRALKESER